MSSGSFIPPLLTIHLESQGTSAKSSVDEGVARTFFHEYVHFLRAMGSTYEMHCHFDVMASIKATLESLGASNDLVATEFSNVRGSPSEFRKHFAFHHRSLDGAYGSKLAFKGGTPAYGHVSMNESMLCWEYVRWNSHDWAHFSTPLGARSLGECFAYLSECLVERTTGQAVGILKEFDQGVESDVHYYTAPLELFINYFGDFGRKLKSNDLLATLQAVLDISLQIPSLKYRSHGQWREMTWPANRFVSMVQALDKVRFIDHEDMGDYDRFCNEISATLGWVSPAEIWRDYYDRVSKELDDWGEKIDQHKRGDSSAYEAHVSRVLKVARESASKCSGAGVSSEKIAQWLADFENTVRQERFAYTGFFGLGILEYMQRALRLRLEEPILLAFPHMNPEKLFRLLPVPEMSFDGSMVQNIVNGSFSVSQDLTAMRHLWALSRLAPTSSRDIACGNLQYRIPCPELSQKTPCPTWLRGADAPASNCTFTQVLNHFNLWGKK